MALLFWDASALVKRYMPESGRDAVNAIFESMTRPDMATTAWGYLETYSILVRRLNGGVLDPPTFSVAVTALQAEVVDNSDFGFLPINETAILSAVSTVRSHNLNAADAAILTILLSFARTAEQSEVILVTADKRLLRAADAEGLKTLNPETFPADDVPSFLASL